MVNIETLKEQNPWWEDKERILQDEKVRVALEKRHKLLYSFENKENKLFVGPRQVGKTTYLKLLIYDLLMNKSVDEKRVFYFSCEILKNFEDIVDVIRKLDFLIEGWKYVFLDEVGFVDGWERGIKYILDSPLSRDKIIYITGSSSINLRKESFPGRPIKIERFLPLSFKEFCRIFGSEELKNSLNLSARFDDIKEVIDVTKKMIIHKDEVDKLFYRFMHCGGFPRTFYELMENGNIKEESYEIYWKWLVHDIAKIEKSEKIFSGVLMGILKNYANKFSLSSIAKETEIGSHVTVRDYLEILEDLFVIKTFYTFDIPKKRVVYRKMRKSYFTDPFLFHVFQRKLLGTSKIDDFSKLVEGIVAENLARKIENIGFYHNRKEVDIVFRNFGIEVKWQEKVGFKDFPKLEIKNKILVSKDDFEFDERKKIAIIPASIFLLIC
jgi:predicted AAA+ superfamily ATPase